MTFSDVLLFVSMCSVPCVYFQLCQSVTRQILLGRKEVVYLNSVLGFGSTELKVTVCINSVFSSCHTQAIMLTIPGLHEWREGLKKEQSFNG